MMLGFHSIDITIDQDGRPHLIEINGSNSGFDGFLIAYGDSSIQSSIKSALTELAPSKDVFVVTRLVNFGELPIGYLGKMIQDAIYFRNVENVHSSLRSGVAGTTWARMRNDRLTSSVGATKSMDMLIQQDPRFKNVMLNVADPRYVIPTHYFREEVENGEILLKEEIRGTVPAIPLGTNDILWLRCPSLAFAEPIKTGTLINPEFPYDAVADNKLFTYEILADEIPESLPVSIPVGNRCSSSDSIGKMLSRARSSLFIRKPLMGSLARGIELMRKEDIEEYLTRIVHLEKIEIDECVGIPLELKGVPTLLMSGVLSFDISLLSELSLSRPVYCRQTDRHHYGCIRSLLLVRKDDGMDLEIRFLGGYWRLAPIPVDGDGLLWERYVASQTQGAFCEPVSTEDMALTESFAKNVITAFYRQLSTKPNSRGEYQNWEMKYWVDRYRNEIPLLKQRYGEDAFLLDLDNAKLEISFLMQQAESAGFRRVPSAVFSKKQVSLSRYPYLIKEPYRIVTV